MKASKELIEYVVEMNYFRMIRSQPTMDARNLSWNEVLDLLEKLENDLSPENLTCDGEIPYAKLMPRVAYLNAVRDELDKMSERYQIDFELNAEIDQELANERSA